MVAFVFTLSLILGGEAGEKKPNAGMGDVMSYVGPFLIRTFDWGNGEMENSLVKVLAKASVVWFVLAVLAIGNGR